MDGVPITVVKLFHNTEKTYLMTYFDISNVKISFAGTFTGRPSATFLNSMHLSMIAFLATIFLYSFSWLSW